MDGFLGGLIVFLEKLAALITAQRFIVLIICLVVVAVLVQNALAAVTGDDPLPLPDEEALELRVTEITGQLYVFLMALAGVLGMFLQLIHSVHRDPPTLRKDWSLRYSMRVENPRPGPIAQVSMSGYPPDFVG